MSRCRPTLIDGSSGFGPPISRKTVRLEQRSRCCTCSTVTRSSPHRVSGSALRCPRVPMRAKLQRCEPLRNAAGAARRHSCTRLSPRVDTCHHFTAVLLPDEHHDRHGQGPGEQQQHRGGERPVERAHRRAAIRGHDPAVPPDAAAPPSPANRGRGRCARPRKSQPDANSCLAEVQPGEFAGVPSGCFVVCPGGADCVVMASEVDPSSLVFELSAPALRCLVPPDTSEP
jgi:hypothetical protein